MKKLLAILLALVMVVSMVGCGNHTAFDLVFSYDRAIICLPDGEVIEGEVEAWTDYEGDQLQITIDGTVYLVHAANAALIVE